MEEMVEQGGQDKIGRGGQTTRRTGRIGGEIVEQMEDNVEWDRGQNRGGESRIWRREGRIRDERDAQGVGGEMKGIGSRGKKRIWTGRWEGRIMCAIGSNEISQCKTQRNYVQ